MEPDTNTDIAHMASRSPAVCGHTNNATGDSSSSRSSNDNYSSPELQQSGRRRSGRVAKRPRWLAEMITTPSSGGATRPRNKEEACGGHPPVGGLEQGQQRRTPTLDSRSGCGGGQKRKGPKQRGWVGDGHGDQDMAGNRHHDGGGEGDQKTTGKRQNVITSQTASASEQDQKRQNVITSQTASASEQDQKRQNVTASQTASASEQDQKTTGKRQNAIGSEGDQKTTGKRRNAIGSEGDQKTTGKKRRISAINNPEGQQESKRRTQKAIPVCQGSLTSADPTTSSEQHNQVLNGHGSSSSAEQPSPRAENSPGVETRRKGRAAHLGKEVTGASARSMKRESSAEKSFGDGHTTGRKRSGRNPTPDCQDRGDKQGGDGQWERTPARGEPRCTDQGGEGRGRKQKTNRCSNNHKHKRHTGNLRRAEQDSDTICDDDDGGGGGDDGDGGGNDHTAEPSDIIDDSNDGSDDGDGSSHAAKLTTLKPRDDAVCSASSNDKEPATDVVGPAAEDGGGVENDDNNDDDDEDSVNKLSELCVAAGSSKSTGAKCSVCGKTFRCSSVLKIHILTHSDDDSLPSNDNESETQQGKESEKDYTCHVCDKSFSTQVQLDKHRRVHEQKGGRKGKGREPKACRVCDKVCVNIHTLRKHELVHTGEKPFVCKACGKGFSQVGNLKIHNRIHTGEKPFNCDICSRAFARAGDLKKHRLTHTDVKSYVCDVCDKAFATPDYLSSHKEIHSGHKPFKCDECDRAFRKAAALKAHKVCHSGVKQFQCQVCSKGFSTRGNLKEHQTTHTGHRPFKCSVCSKAFTKAFPLQKHMMLHTGIRPFPCNLCNKGYATRSELEIHKRTHTGDRPYKCESCPADFFRKANLQQHVSAVHWRIKPFVCDLCGKAFSENRSLVEHRRIHSGVKPYMCEMCGKAFTQASTLKNHERTHTGEKPYSCRHCGKTFSGINSRNRHLRTHTGEAPYKCHQCPAHFSRLETLKAHVLNWHPGGPSTTRSKRGTKDHAVIDHCYDAPVTFSLGTVPSASDLCEDVASRCVSAAPAVGPDAGEASCSSDTPFQGEFLQALSEGSQSVVVPLLITVEDDGKIIYQATLNSRRSISAAGGVEERANDAPHIVTVMEMTSDCSDKAAETEAREQADSAYRSSPLSDRPAPVKLESNGDNASYLLQSDGGPDMIPVIFQQHDGGTVDISAVIDALVTTNNDTVSEAAPNLNVKLSSQEASHVSVTGSETSDSSEIQVSAVPLQTHCGQEAGLCDVVTVSSSSDTILESATVDVVTDSKVAVGSDTAKSGSTATSISVTVDSAMSMGTVVSASTLTTDSAVIHSTVSPDTAVIHSTVSPDTAVIHSTVSPDMAVIHSTVLPDTAMIQSTVSPDTAVIRSTVSPDTAVIQRTVSPDMAVIHSTVSQGLAVTGNTMASDLMVIDNTMTVYTTLSDGAVTADSAMTDSMVTAVIKTEIEDYTQSGAGNTELENACEQTPTKPVTEAQTDIPHTADYFKSEAQDAERMEAVASGNNEMLRVMAVQLPPKPEAENSAVIPTDSGEGKNEESASPDVDYGQKSDPAQINPEWSPGVRIGEASRSLAVVDVTALGAEHGKSDEQNLGSQTLSDPPDTSDQHAILRDLLTESSSPSMKMKQATQAGLRLSTLRSKGVVNVLMSKRRYGVVPKQWICEVCGHGFTQAASLKNHIAIQHNSSSGGAVGSSKTVRCDVCSKLCRSRSELAAHRRSHTGDRPFLCHLCHKTYKHNGDLQQHVLASHLGARPHTCQDCGKAFTERRSLKEHQLIHRGLKPHTCCTCGKAFTQQGTLRKHQLTHTGGRGSSGRNHSDTQDKLTGTGRNPYEAGDTLSGGGRNTYEVGDTLSGGGRNTYEVGDTLSGGDRNTYEAGDTLSGGDRNPDNVGDHGAGARWKPRDSDTGADTQPSRSDTRGERFAPLPQLHGHMLVHAGEEEEHSPAHQPHPAGLRWHSTAEHAPDALEDLAAVASLALASR